VLSVSKRTSPMQPLSPLISGGHTPLAAFHVLFCPPPCKTPKFSTHPFYPSHPPKMILPLLCKSLLQRRCLGAQATCCTPLLCSLLLISPCFTHPLPKMHLYQVRKWSVTGWDLPFLHRSPAPLLVLSSFLELPSLAAQSNFPGWAGRQPVSAGQGEAASCQEHGAFTASPFPQLLSASHLTCKPLARWHSFSLAGDVQENLGGWNADAAAAHSSCSLLPWKNHPASLCLQQNPSRHQPRQDRFWPFLDLHGGVYHCLFLCCRSPKSPEILASGWKFRICLPPLEPASWGQNAKEQT